MAEGYHAVMSEGCHACMQRHMAVRAHPYTLPSLDRPSGIPPGGTIPLLGVVQGLDLPVLETPNPHRVSSSSRSQPVPGITKVPERPE